jgi:hypothetical protein
MASQHLTPSPPSPLPLGEGCRGKGKELAGQPLLFCRISKIVMSVRKGFVTTPERVLSIIAKDKLLDQS